jgi:DNA-binding HxlR family transcriptional regulator
VPKTAWTGYERFCPLARALDVVGDRWTLVIVQELLKCPRRYSDLARRLPGIGSTVLADRLRKLEAARVVERITGAVGEGVVYTLTEQGLALSASLEALRRWGVNYLADPTADGQTSHQFDLHYVEGIDSLDDVELGLVVDERATTLRFSAGRLKQVAGEAANAVLTVRTTGQFMERWAAGSVSWDEGRSSGEVQLDGSDDHWVTWLAATGYLLVYDPEQR